MNTSYWWYPSAGGGGGGDDGGKRRGQQPPAGSTYLNMLDRLPNVHNSHFLHAFGHSRTFFSFFLVPPLYYWCPCFCAPRSCIVYGVHIYSGMRGLHTGSVCTWSCMPMPYLWGSFGPRSLSSTANATILSASVRMPLVASSCFFRGTL